MGGGYEGPVQEGGWGEGEGEEVGVGEGEGEGEEGAWVWMWKARSELRKAMRPQHAAVQRRASGQPYRCLFFFHCLTFFFLNEPVLRMCCARQCGHSTRRCCGGRLPSVQVQTGLLPLFFLLLFFPLFSLFSLFLVRAVYP